MNRRLALAPARTIAFGTEPGAGPRREQSTPLVNNAAWAGYGTTRAPAYIPEVPVEDTRCRRPESRGPTGRHHSVTAQVMRPVIAVG